jgi:hypothetical protein
VNAKNLLASVHVHLPLLHCCALVSEPQTASGAVAMELGGCTQNLSLAVHVCGMHKQMCDRVRGAVSYADMHITVSTQ